jgi:hypothetical protein
MLIRWHGDVALVDATALAVMRRVTVRHARRLQPAVACDLRTRVLLFQAETVS